jgi:proton-translocating NADH-quinone oxidoreductase chain N
MNTLTLSWLIAAPLAGSPLVYLAGRLLTSSLRIERAAWVVRVLALLALLAAWWVYVPVLQALLADGPRAFTVESLPLSVDGLSLLVTGTVLTLSSAAVLFSWHYMAGETGEEKYYAMLLAMTGMIIGLSMARDLFNLWVWFEAMAVASYLLVAFYREQPASLEAGMKYLVQSAAGSVLVLIGIALVLSTAGTLEIALLRDAAGATAPRPSLLAAGALFVIGFGVKAALVPLHTWLPDAHSQAPSAISAMLSGIVIEAGLIAMLIALSAVGAAPTWGATLLAFGAINILYGNLLALRQTQVKRLLAFSSLSHMGYMLLGLGIALQTGAALGAQGALFHLFNHMLMKGLAFLAAGALMYGLFIAGGQHKSLSIDDLAGAAQRYPLPALALSVAVLALGGLPPLAGFISKWQIFVAGFAAQDGWITALVVFAALNSVLSLGYYAPLVNAMYRQEPSPAVRAGAPVPAMMQLTLAALVVLVIAIGCVPGLLDWLTGPAARDLLALFAY